MRDGSGDGGGRDGGSGGSYRHMSRAPTRDKSGSAVSPRTLAPHLAPHLAARSIHVTVGVPHAPIPHLARPRSYLDDLQKEFLGKFRDEIPSASRPCAAHPPPGGP